VLSSPRSSALHLYANNSESTGSAIGELHLLSCFGEGIQKPFLIELAEYLCAFNSAATVSTVHKEYHDSAATVSTVHMQCHSSAATVSTVHRECYDNAATMSTLHREFCPFYLLEHHTDHGNYVFVDTCLLINGFFNGIFHSLVSLVGRCHVSSLLSSIGTHIKLNVVSANFHHASQG
jgi:hypothetical protein